MLILLGDGNMPSHQAISRNFRLFVGRISKREEPDKVRTTFRFQEYLEPIWICERPFKISLLLILDVNHNLDRSDDVSAR